MKQFNSRIKSLNSRSQPFKIASAQVNPILGDFEANAKKILKSIEIAKSNKARLIVFPESVLFGYHPFDLLERKEVVEAQLRLLKFIIQKMPSGIMALVGHISKNKNRKGRPYFNSSSLIKKGRLVKTFHKELLPTGDVFDEARFIESGKIADNIFVIEGRRFLVTICEDMWAWPSNEGFSQYKKNPLLELKGQKFDLIINQSASPFYIGKMETRLALAKKSAKFFKAPFLYTNLVGAQDEIIFDGSSFCIDKKGKTVMLSQSLQEDLNYIDLDKGDGGKRPALETEAELLRQALVLGIRDFCEKIGIKKLHLGLSGGVDSAVVACLAVDALGPKRVTCIYMASEFNSNLSESLAKNLAFNLKCRLIELPISDVFSAMRKSMDSAYNISEFGLPHENLQARIRGTFLMAYSNSSSSLLLNTSNKSEFAAGYSTLYGDMCGGLCPLGDLTKAQVYELARHYNSQVEIIPQRILERAPSAELRPNQKDSDSLPPYEVLDESVHRIVEKCAKPKTVTDKWLIQAIYRSEFKRWQAPPILKVSEHSFGRGRRYPIAHRAR